MVSRVSGAPRPYHTTFGSILGAGHSWNRVSEWVSERCPAVIPHLSRVPPDNICDMAPNASLPPKTRLCKACTGTPSACR